jgi:hypothetical protein
MAFCWRLRQLQGGFQSGIQGKEQKMLNQVGPNADCTSAGTQPGPAPDAFETRLPADFTRLSGDEIERLIGLCEAPSLLWCPDVAPAREPEPFGMIA